MDHDLLPAAPFTAQTAARLGISRHQLREALADGSLRRYTRGVFARADLQDDALLRAQVIALGASRHHVAVDRTAAWLHGVDALTLSEHDLLHVVETCALSGHHPTARAEARGRTRDLQPSDVTVVHGVRVTTPLRTALDLGCHLRRREAHAAMSELAGLHDLTAEMMTRELGRFRGRRGVVQLRELVPSVEPGIESPREAWILLALLDAGLPRPEPQVWVEIDGEPVYRLDFAYRRAKVAIEYDGSDSHSSPAQQAHDRERRERLRALGWRVIVVRRGDFTDPQLRLWIRGVREALAPSYTNRRW
ncbi:DUF559 domain-containing protein [Nocardioides sp. GY 10113]|uniref:DUF559 domain-containing protein n=1 Tax=Nocardioides sp. GY 10113 TaxID=2569761 RepID=UPI0010A80DB7|nr:DUF559 domain-containing protein [Nocardioides sp. GY 10113]TIC87790.1 DUF559 domain-containing protein [Nocardioides sp. GY 10113]